MNEKMKELIAGAVARGWCSPENSHKEMDVVLAMAIGQEVEKLAELIITECVKVLDNMADPEDSERYFWAIQNAVTKIQEHFGIEE